MQVSVENIGSLERKLTVKFPAERFETQVSARIAESWWTDVAAPVRAGCALLAGRRACAARRGNRKMARCPVPKRCR
jgi:hypothetical protein